MSHVDVSEDAALGDELSRIATVLLDMIGKATDTLEDKETHAEVMRADSVGEAWQVFDNVRRQNEHRFSEAENAILLEYSSQTAVVRTRLRRLAQGGFDEKRRYDWITEMTTAPTEVGLIRDKVVDVARRLRGTKALVVDMGPVKPQDQAAMPNTVFVVHGHDAEAVTALKDYLRVLRLVPVTWDEVAARAPNGPSSTTLEIVQTGIESSAAVLLLFTPDERTEIRDDLAASGSNELRHQPRPNVIFEAGWALAFDRKKVVIVQARGDTRISDIDGVNYVRLTEEASSFDQLIKRLGATTCDPSEEDPARLDIKRYSALYESVAPPTSAPPTSAPPTANAGERWAESLATLTDEEVVEVLMDHLPDPGFHLFSDLDAAAGAPAGTWAKHGPAAASRRDRLARKSENGMRLGGHVIQRTRSRRGRP